jgi:hypothetical protein
VLKWLAKECSKDPNSGIYGNVMFAFGAAVFAHNSKGSASCPIWSLRMELSFLCLLFLVNEYNSSKRCQRCKACIVRGVRVKGEQRDLHGVRYCRVCRLRMNRDINAALNMRYIFLYQLAMCGARPLGYKAGKRVLPEAAWGRVLRKFKAPKDAAELDTKGKGKSKSKAGKGKGKGKTAASKRKQASTVSSSENSEDGEVPWMFLFLRVPV